MLMNSSIGASYATGYYFLKNVPIIFSKQEKLVGEFFCLYTSTNTCLGYTPNTCSSHNVRQLLQRHAYFNIVKTPFSLHIKCSF
jgi:hypothetical protein